MAYRGVLPEAPSFGTTLARNLGSGLSGGLSQAGNFVMQMMKSRAKERAQSLKDQMARLDKSGSYVGKELKSRYPDLAFHEDDMSDIVQHYRQLIQENPDLSSDEALEGAVNLFRRGQEEKWGPGGRKSGDPLTDSTEHPFGILGEFLSPAIKTAKEKPSQLAKELPTAALKSAESWANLADPGKMIINAIASATGRKPSAELSDLVAERLREGLSEEQKQGAENIAQTESVLIDVFGPSLASRLMKMAGIGAKPSSFAQTAIKGVRGAEDTLATSRKAEQELAKASTQRGAVESLASERLLGKRAAEEAAQGETLPTSRAISKEAPSKATEMRIERLNPASKTYKPKEQAALRESQLKLVPQYEAEIAEDAAKRAAQAEARTPKTAVGMAGRASRMQAAEANLPKAQDGYYKAIGRVRALEDQIASMAEGPAKEQAQKILQAATKELQEAEFGLKQAVENLRGESVRAGIPEMEKAAQEKLTKIADSVVEGQEIPLAKMDYNPEHIKKAKSLSKSKIPASREEDFYTQVHDTYIKQYQNRLGKLDQEMTMASKNRSLSGLLERRNIEKQRDAIKKMIESAEAENAIHRHKLALREIQQRKLAKERFSKLKPTEGKEKVKEAFSEKAWKQKISQAKTTEEKAKVVQEGVEKIAQSHPAKAEQIKKEGSGILESLEKVKQEASDPIESAKEAPQKASKILSHFSEMKDNFPYLWKSRMGRDLILGTASAVWDDYAKEEDWSLKSATFLPFLGGGTRGIGYRFAFRQLTNMVLKMFHQNRAEEAYLKRDRKKFQSFSPKIQKKVKEKMRDRSR